MVIFKFGDVFLYIFFYIFTIIVLLLILLTKSELLSYINMKQKVNCTHFFFFFVITIKFLSISLDLLDSLPLHLLKLCKIDSRCSHIVFFYFFLMTLKNAGGKNSCNPLTGNLLQNVNQHLNINMKYRGFIVILTVPKFYSGTSRDKLLLFFCFVFWFKVNNCF